MPTGGDEYFCDHLTATHQANESGELILFVSQKFHHVRVPQTLVFGLCRQRDSRENQSQY